MLAFGCSAGAAWFFCSGVSVCYDINNAYPATLHVVYVHRVGRLRFGGYTLAYLMEACV